MNQRSPKQKAMDQFSLLRLLQELEEGTLGRDETAELMSQLNASRAARRIYLEYFQDSASLEHYASMLDEQGRLPVIVSSFVSRKVYALPILAAAAVVMLFVTIASLYKLNVPKNPTLSTAAIRGTEWSVDGMPRGADHNEVTIKPGTLIEVESGTVRLQESDGSTLILQGPAIVSFPSVNKPLLRKGWLWIDTGESGLSFEVTTPDLLVRDIGTRFGVRVHDEGPTEIHVIHGEVEAIARKDLRHLATLKPDNKGYEISANESRLAIPLGDDPFPSLPKLLKAKPSYATTVLSQAPAGYWTLDETKGARKLGNEISNTKDAEAGAEVVVGEASFGKDSRSVRLTGQGAKSIIGRINSPSGTSRKEGAVSFWIRRNSDIQAEEVLWLAGLGTPERTQPKQSLIYTSLTPTGQVRLFIENGNSDVALLSSENIADGRWHQIAASWSSAGVFLFIDGIQTDQDTQTKELKESTARGRDVRFGKPSDDLIARNLISYAGWVDEIALWNRPLTLTEVNKQFESAKGEVQR